MLQHEDEHLLYNLPVELLLKVFYFCDLSALAKLSCTCKKLSALCADEILWRKIIRSALLPVQGPSLGPGSTERISSVWRSISAKTQCQMIWEFKERSRNKPKATCLRNLKGGSGRGNAICMNKVLLDDLGLWTSDSVTVFRLPWQLHSGKLTAHSKRFDRFLRSTDPARHVGDFTVSSECLITGHWDGSIIVGGINAGDTSKDFVIKPHLSDVHSVTVHHRLLVSGSRDHTVSYFDLETHNRRILANFDDRIWIVDNHPSLPITAVGTSATTQNPLLRISGVQHAENAKSYSLEQCNLRLFDYEREAVVANLKKNFRHGFGILALQFTNHDTLWSGGHDGVLRCWDLRENRCTQELDPDLDSAVYCFCTDGLHTLVTGHANYNAICLWDRRYSRYPVQTRSVEQEYGETKASCSVYGLCFSPFELYIGLADGVYKLPFCS